MKKQRYFISFLLVLTAMPLFGQGSDSLPVFGYDQFLQVIRDNHPMYQRATLLNEQAQATLRGTRGAFDPVLEADLLQKNFDNKDYFTRQEAGVRVPSTFGVEFKAGYKQARGLFLNPEAELPTAGQAFAGVKVPVLRGLLTDERRAALRQARLMIDLNEVARRQLVNDLLFEGAQVYWTWVLATQERNIQQQAEGVAAERFNVSRERFFQGDIPAVDTLEALIQFQNRTYALSEAEKKLIKARQDLSNFLWSENGEPLVLSQQVRAPDLTPVATSGNLEQLLETALPLEHPALEAYRLKIEQLEVERRLKSEYLKPKLDVEYNFLADGSDFLAGTSDDLSTATALINENYQWGIQFSFPVFLRKARADIQLTDIKLTEAGLDRKNKRQHLQNKLITYQNQYIIGLEQLTILKNVRDNYELLLEAEKEKFRIGESSLFLLNSRELNLIQANIKLFQLQTRLHILEVGMRWAAGLLE